jgi:3'(2'), 5'-bisphosphate nucleotidase
MSEVETGLAAVRAAARLCEAVRAELVGGSGPAALDKQDRSPVTVADFGSQALVCQRIQQHFPDDWIVAEEDSAVLRQPEHAAALERVTEFIAEQLPGATDEAVCRWIDLGQGQPASRYWVLDPIDGTKGFLRNDQYAIALALIENGEVQLGVLGCPALPRQDGGNGALFVARRGAGAQTFSMEGRSLGQLRVSDLAEPSQARLAESFETAHTNRGLSAQVREVLGIGVEPLRMDSQAKYACLATGQAEIYLRAPNPSTPEYRENVWDHAAGWLVVTEAGGQVSDVYGRRLDWSSGRRLEHNLGVLATNGPLHAPVIEALAPLLTPRA